MTSPECEFKAECINQMRDECDSYGKERCGVRKFAILVGTRRWNEAIEKVLTLEYKFRGHDNIKALKMEEE